MSEVGVTVVRIDYLEGRVDDHEDRLRKVEHSQWRMTGILGAVTALAALAGSILGAFVR